MDDSRKDEPSEILNRHAAADLRGLALTERDTVIVHPNDEVSAAVRPTVYRDGDLAAAAERWLILHAGRFHVLHGGVRERFPDIAIVQPA